MLCCGNKQSSPEQETDQRISQMLQKGKKKSNQVYKLLLLGPGESGKSTFAKQIKILHTTGFQKEEVEFFRNVIFYNILNSMKTLCEQSILLKIPVENEELVHSFLRECDGFSKMDTTFGGLIQNLWAEAGIRQTMDHYTQFPIVESAVYYFEHIARISARNWVPSHEDILQSRARTTGVIELDFAMENSNFKLVDVGGQRSERNKWIHCFENVNAVIFIAAISEYNLTLAEDSSVNRLEESLKLFKEISNSKWFQNTPVLLFLNKIDLFEKKMKEGDLSNYFPDFKGGSNYEAGLKFMEEKFRQQTKRPVSTGSNTKKSDIREIFVHFTCATDTTQVRKVFQDTKTMVLNNALSGAGILD